MLRAVIRDAPANTRLPSSRTLVAQHLVSPVTVARAISRLAAEGSVIVRPGQGTFTPARPSRVSGAPDTSWQSIALVPRDLATVPVDLPLDRADGAISLAGGYLHPSLQPLGALRSGLARGGRRPHAWERSAPSGIEPLRALMARQIGPPIAAEDVLITAGGQAALSLVFRAIAPAGLPVLVESPTYSGALAAIRGAGLQPGPVPLDERGIRPDMLAEAFATTGARVFYCQPGLHNPTGRTLAEERRAEILDVASTAGAFVVEDDFARHLAHGRPLPRPLVADDERAHVIHVTSLTKPTSPSFRLGAVAARGPVKRRLDAVRYVDDFFVARPLQEAAVELLTSPAWDRHVRSLGPALRNRRQLTAAALAQHVPDWTIDVVPRAGLHLWVRMPKGLNDAVMVDAARRQGVLVNGGSAFFPSDAPTDRIRINFAAADLSQLDEAVQRLSAAALAAREAMS